MPCLGSTRVGWGGHWFEEGFISFYRGTVLMFLRMLASFRVQFDY